VEQNPAKMTSFAGNNGIFRRDAAFDLFVVFLIRQNTDDEIAEIG
jgi:hypothetical protein